MCNCFCKVKLGWGATTHHCINLCGFLCRVYLFIDLASLFQNIHCWISLSCSVVCSLTWCVGHKKFCRFSPPPIPCGLCLDKMWNLRSMFFSKIHTVCPNGICMVIFTQHNERFKWCSLCLLNWYAPCLMLISSLFRTAETHAVERRQRKSEAPARPTGSRLFYSDLTWTWVTAVC